VVGGSAGLPALSLVHELTNRTSARSARAYDERMTHDVTHARAEQRE
jgi:hypothetical protein